MNKKWILQKIMYFALGITLMLFLGIIYGDSQSAFKSTITPIDKINTNKKVVAIACNVYEGEDILPSMIKTLDENKVKISFFIGGVWAKKNIPVIQSIKDNGHDIQNHGYYHKRPTQLSLEDNMKEVKLTEDLLSRELGIKTTLFEPPFGDFDENTQKIIQRSDHKLVTFNIDTIDWREDANEELLLKRISKKLNPGGIILMHPKEVTAKSLDPMLKYIKSQGYEILTVNELLSIK